MLKTANPLLPNPVQFEGNKPINGQFTLNAEVSEGFFFNCIYVFLYFPQVVWVCVIFFLISGKCVLWKSPSVDQLKNTCVHIILALSSVCFIQDKKF